MESPVQELKTRAELLHAGVASGERDALRRLRVLPELAKADDAALTAAAAGMQRKHCLAVVAREHGFSRWDQALRVLSGDLRERDVGTLLYDDASRGALNVWFATHAEARAHLDAAREAGQRRYLLAYRTQFFVVEAPFVQTLGLDPDDPDWERLGFDWARPADPAARASLYQKRLHALRRAS
jgi:GNAT superfamily N-acetyltransferase